MKRVGIREFRDRATRYLAGGEVLELERHGALVGYFVPVLAKPEESQIEQAVARLRSEALDPDALARLRSRRNELAAASARRGAHNIRVFGSVARGEARTDSDVDLLVDFDDDRSLLDLAGLVEDLGDLLGRRVDVVTERGLKASIRDSVLADVVPL